MSLAHRERAAEMRTSNGTCLLHGAKDNAASLLPVAYASSCVPLGAVGRLNSGERAVR